MKKFISVPASIFALSFSPLITHTATAHENVSARHMISQGKLFVSATGQAAQAPDRASVSAGVVTRAPTAGEAMRANARQMNGVFAALRAAGIQTRNITTSQMSLQPQYDYQNRQAPRITGYEARNTVRAISDDLENVGLMLDALVSAGVNTINGVTFSVKDTKSARAHARRAAIANARTKAENMAAAAGVRLGRVLEIRESGGYTPRPQPMMVRSAVEMDATPISAGEQTLSVTVSITYALD